MNWLIELFTNHGIAQTVVVYGCVIAIGVLLGKVKLFNVSLGITWVLFAGIAASHFGFTVDKQLEHFLKEFGLILFVYSIGLQVGPGFFASMKKQALGINLLAACVVFLGVGTTIALFYITGNNIGIMTGLLSGAVTNTPGLGAAQQAVLDMGLEKQVNMSSIGLAYAITYPFGVIGIIIVLLFFKRLFKVDLEREQAKLRRLQQMDPSNPVAINLQVTNEMLINKPLKVLASIVQGHYVVSRMCRDGEIFSPTPDTVLAKNDVLLFVAPKRSIAQLKLVVGAESELVLQRERGTLSSRRIVVTNKTATYKPLGRIRAYNQPDFNITRISRAGIEFIANANTMLNLGDQVTVVGSDAGIRRATDLMGNSLKRLKHPELGPIFIGIVLGVILGSIPIFIPGVPVPVKIGLAGGPLIVAILLSHFGNRLYLINYTTHSANLMLREIGIVLFLASVGLGSGENFAEILKSGTGWYWMGLGVFITLIPLLTVGLLARYVFRLSYFEICGLLSGASTDPPALAFAIQTAGSDVPSVTYATVYPLTMILRIITAEMLVMFFY